MKKVRTILDECTREQNRINSCIESLSALDGARNTQSSLSLLLAGAALGHADALSSRLRGLMIRYRMQLERKLRSGKAAA